MPTPELTSNRIVRPSDNLTGISLPDVQPRPANPRIGQLQTFDLSSLVREGVAGVRIRIQRHRQILQGFQLVGLEGLGDLRISENAVVRPGLLRPGGEIFESPISHRINVRLPLPDLPDLLGQQKLLVRPTKPIAFPIALKLLSRKTAGGLRLEKDVYLEDAYWVGETIEIANDTTIVFDAPYGHLTIICKSLIIGDNVTITWKMPDLPPDDPSRSAPADGRGDDGEGSNANDSDGDGHGLNGGNGYPAKKDANDGPDGDDAPVVELWTLNLNRWPKIILDGQDGWPGGPGCNGGNGGNGANGRNGEFGLLPPYLKNPGDGGRGGNAGQPTAGGSGGSGGHGGQFIVYGPKLVLATRSRLRASISCEGGEPGESGPDGRPGRAGPGVEETGECGSI